MNLRQLGYFVRIIEMRSMTRAAESLHVAQPALSQQIALLERDLGVRLLVRGPKGVQTTPEGLLLYRHAQTILRQVESTRSILTRAEGQVAGTVAIGLASSTAHILALPLMRLVKQEYPAIVLEIVDLPSADLTKMVLQGRLDFALSPDQAPIKGLSVHPLLVEDLLLLSPSSFKLPGREVSIRHLAKFPLILPGMPNKLRARVDNAFMNAHLPCQLFAEASTSSILVPAVKAGLAATILPYSAAYLEIAEGIISANPLSGGFSREISLCAGEGVPLLPAVLSVIELTTRAIASLIENGTWRACRLLQARSQAWSAPAYGAAGMADITMIGDATVYE